MKYFLIALVLTSFFELYAQNAGSYYNPKDDKYRLLGLKRARELYESAKADFERQSILYDKQMLSAKELESAKSRFADAEVNYHQALLAVLFEQQYISVIEAVKYQTKEGKKHVRLKLANTSGGGEEFKKLINIEDELFKSLQPEVVNDVYISLLNESNAIISQPYEAKIEEIRFGKPVTVDFVMLQDLDAVTVNIIYGSGTQRAPKIYLQKDQSENKVLIQSEQFSQEVELGKNASYNMSLELFSGITNTFKLEVVNLPNQITSYFTDPLTQARLSQFKFNESSLTKRAALQVYLPDRSTNEVVIDKPISFFVLAIPYERYDEFKNMANATWTKEQIENLNIGYVKLELIPRGRGELLVRATQLYYSAQEDDKISVPVTVVNEGTRRLDNIEFNIDLPLNWTKEIKPQIINKLGVREEAPVDFTFIPPAGISPGKYEVRIQTTSLSEGQPVRAEDKTITIEILPEANILGTVLIIVLLLGVIGGIVVFGIKISRK